MLSVFYYRNQAPSFLIGKSILVEIVIIRVKTFTGQRPGTVYNKMYYEKSPVPNYY